MKAGGGHMMTVGEMLRTWLSKLEWYSTLFPRIPVPIQKVRPLLSLSLLSLTRTWLSKLGSFTLFPRIPSPYRRHVLYYRSFARGS